MKEIVSLTSRKFRRMKVKDRTFTSPAHGYQMAVRHRIHQKWLNRQARRGAANAE